MSTVASYRFDLILLLFYESYSSFIEKVQSFFMNKERNYIVIQYILIYLNYFILFNYLFMSLDEKNHWSIYQSSQINLKLDNDIFKLTKYKTIFLNFIIIIVSRTI